MKYFNRFASAAMAGAMALSLAAPAFAVDPPANQTEVTGTYADPEIAVVVPTTGTAVVNPYKLPVKVTLSDAMTQVALENQQITTRPMDLRNQSDIDLDVYATLKVAPAGDLEVAASKGTNNATTCKEVKIDLQVAGLDDPKYNVYDYDETLTDNLINAFADAASWTGAKTLAAPAASKGTAAASITAAKSKDTVGAMATLGKADLTDGMIKYGADSIALFRLTGDLNEDPNNGTADAPWATTDGFTATIAFSFKPAANAGGGGPVATSHNITEGTHVETAGSVTAVTFEVGGNAASTADKDDSVDVTVTATAGKTVSISVNGAASVSLTEGAAGTYTGTFTMPDADAEVIVTVAA